MVEPSIPLPLEPTPPPEADKKRLWIGNIDSRLTEYNLLKIVQKFGKIKKFDFLFHKSGALKGQPRGYTFVTYETRGQAESALAALNGKQVLGKNMVVRWAHTAPSESFTAIITPAVLSKSSEETKPTKSPTSQILAIEAKLKAMEEQHEKELEMCLSASPVAPEDPILTNKSVPKMYRKARSAPYNVHQKKQLKGNMR